MSFDISLIKVIALDFDGVIVESNDIKYQAFRTLFAPYKEHYQEIVDYCLSNHAIVRHDKFNYIADSILKIDNKKDIIDEWLEKFSLLTRENVIKCPMVNGADNFLRYFSRDYKLYLVSATPLDELKIILKERGLNHYFTMVYGAPLIKSEILNQIVEIEKISTKNLLYIGDSITDYTAAKANDIPFIGRISDYQFKETMAWSDLNEIGKHLTQGDISWDI